MDIPVLFSLRSLDLSPNFTYRTATIESAPNYGKTAGWEETAIMGRSAPIVNFGSSQGVSFPIAIKLVAQKPSDPATFQEIVDNFFAIGNAHRSRKSPSIQSAYHVSTFPQQLPWRNGICQCQQ